MSVCEHLCMQSLGSARRSRTNDVSLSWFSKADDGPNSWSELSDLDWSKFRLVLGAGGTTGGVFACGILLALATDHDVDLSNASHLVGTSAGSVVATLIAMGLDGDDLAAVVARTGKWLTQWLATLPSQ